MPAEFVGVGEAAELLGLSRASVQKLVDQGKLPAVKTTGGHRRVLRSSVAELTAQMSIQTKAPTTLTPSLFKPGASQIHILIVEEQSDAAANLAHSLQAHYPQVVCIVAADELDAILKIERIRPSLVIASLGAANLDGLKVIRFLQKHPEYRGMFVIALTDWSPVEIAAQGGLADDVLCIPKVTALERVRGLLDAHMHMQRPLNHPATASV